jgi:hypothetical protein
MHDIVPKKKKSIYIYIYTNITINIVSQDFFIFLISCASKLSTPAEKLLYLCFIFILFFLDIDPHLASVVCDFYLFSVSRYELCVCGNLCTCVRVSTNLESPPTMGNFKV